jgi:hypothetical protein
VPAGWLGLLAGWLAAVAGWVDWLSGLALLAGCACLRSRLAAWMGLLPAWACRLADVAGCRGFLAGWTFLQDTVLAARVVGLLGFLC